VGYTATVPAHGFGNYNLEALAESHGGRMGTVTDKEQKLEN
jgi:hypothetical protein